MGWPCYRAIARLGFRRHALLALYSTQIKFTSCSPQIISVCAYAITQLTQYTSIATHAQENGRTVFKGCSHKQSGVTLKAAKRIYIYVAMCGTCALFILPAKQSLQFFFFISPSNKIQLKKNTNLQNSVPPKAGKDTESSSPHFEWHLQIFNYIVLKVQTSLAPNNAKTSLFQF